MNKNRISKIEKLFFLVCLGIGIVLVIRMDDIYRENRKIRLEKLAKLEKIKIEKVKELELANISLSGVTKEFNLNINDTDISPNIIEANLGDKLVINIKVNEGYHNLKLDFYDVMSKNIATGNSDQIDFVATKSGVFKIFSNTSRYEEPEPEGVLIIK